MQSSAGAAIEREERDISEGMSIGPWVRSGGFATWNRFAAVNDEFIPIHMDDEAGRLAGMPGAFGMGNLTMSWLHALVREWAADDGQITSFSIRFRKPALKGEVTCAGLVTALSTNASETTAQVALTATHEHGDVLVSAEATVVFRTRSAPVSS
jgi:acyl dehydratase